MCASTLLRWTKGQRSTAAFERVLVAADRAPPSALVVHGPCGLRIEGLDVAAVAELVRTSRRCAGDSPTLPHPAVHPPFFTNWLATR